MVNELSDPRDVVVCAAGSMPGDLHKLWRTRDPKGYHVEYGYSCMGYEVAGGIGVRLACPDRDVFVMVGDGSYLMMATELATAVQEGIKIITVLVQNHGYASIGSLSESLGSQRFGTPYRYRNPADGPAGRGRPAGRPGRERRQLRPRGDQDRDRRGVRRRGQGGQGGRATRCVIYVETDPLIGAPDSRVLVGRAGQRHLDAGVHPAGPRTYEEHKATQQHVPQPHPLSHPDLSDSPPAISKEQETRVASKITIGTAPDSWGVWFPSDPEQVPGQHLPAGGGGGGLRGHRARARTATCRATPASCRRRWTSTG